MTVNLLEVIAGGLIARFVYRRRLMCLLQTIFSEVTQRSDNTVLVLGSELKEELILCCLLVTTAVTDLKAHYNPKIFACDASGWGEAVVSLQTSEPFAKEMYRHCLHKSVWDSLAIPCKSSAQDAWCVARRARITWRGRSSIPSSCRLGLHSKGWEVQASLETEVKL